MAEWSRLREVLEAALDAPAGDRGALLDRLCTSAEERREVEVLLAGESACDERLDPPSHAGVEDLVAALEGARLVGRRAGPYRLVELLATGGMGEVYKGARDDGAFDRFVAVKVIRRSVMSPGAARRFGAERRLLARLSHPNIAALLDGGEIDGRPFLVLEYVQGVPLREYCAREGLGPRARVRLVRTVCAAAAHAHQNLIVHRDLKPSNVLVSPDGTPKLLDFGISKLLGADADDATMTMTRMLTPRYASPEQLRGEPVSTASDVYSLGVILHETLTGRAWGERPGGTRGTPQLSGEVEPPSRAASGIDRELDAIVLQALEPDPARRYPSAEAMGADLQRWLDGERVLAFAATRWHRARKWARRHRLALGAAGTVAALITSTAVVAAVMAARLAAERRETLAARRDAERISRFLGGVIESAGERALGGQLTLGALLDDAEHRLEREAADAPAVAGPARLALGRAYLSMGRTTDGGALLRAAVDNLAQAHGEDDARTAFAREEYARHLTLAGRFEEAEEEYTRVLGTRRSARARDPVALAGTLHGLGRMELIRGNDGASERYLREALALCEGAGDEPATAPVLDTFGWLAIARGDGPAAVEYRERALEIRRRHSAPGTPGVAAAVGSLGEACYVAGDLERAEALLREAHEAMVAGVGAMRAFTLDQFYVLARVVEARGDLPAAEAMYLAGITELEGGLPSSRHEWVYMRENYAIFLSRRGRLSEARPHFALAAEAYQELLGAEHLRTQMARRAVEWVDGTLSGEPGLESPLPPLRHGGAPNRGPSRSGTPAGGEGG